jgi:N-acetylglucosaminyl-diphospho-decaprenol L-rhamnosyltransferase
LAKRSDADNSLAPEPAIVADPADMADDRISVVMVTYHSGTVLFKSLEIALADPLVSELILIDNGTKPEVIVRLKEMALAEPRLKYIDSGSNMGFGRAVNLGVGYCRFPWIVVLNPDAFLQPGCLSGLREAAREGSRPCLVGARLLNPDLSEQRGSRRGEVTPVTTLVSLLRLEKALPFLDRFELHYHDHPLPDAPIEVPTVSGACFLISKADFLLLDGFDPVFFLHVEDVDLCWRARKMGGRVLFHPTASVIHVGHTSLVDPTFVEHHKGEGLIYFFKKRADTGWRKLYLFFLTPLIRVVSYLRAFRRETKENDE